ncbi:MAG: tRNA (N6-isopentenyl adenosine(37)-C2)-methylthiotransferase MiaB [Coriobacteriales bacterium]|nr:tRNA (N6-isopentenyl adenosine(37)-C2)-methylthiotransferase MiaB [Coriobacteriales bacterium]
MAEFPVLVGKTYLVRTFGCQMNLHDSERVRGLLESCGCVEARNTADADIVVFMTCCVREHADTKLYGQATSLISAPEPPCGKRIVAIGGCIAQRDGATIRKHIPNANVVFGTSAIATLPALLQDAFSGDGKAVVADTREDYEGFSTDLPTKRDQPFRAWVPIMTGCNNFCTYCIVPHVRGRETSRPLEAIVRECEHLVDEGTREITLLGQNVNSYGRDLYGSPRFAQLLDCVCATGIERVRFTSSNPKDLNGEVIDAMARNQAVMPHLHLAVQSGSTRVLKAMNRTYTREQYLELARALREAMPELALSTDVIVGFPGEEEADFLDTLTLMCEVGFSSAYTFIYSRRPGTPAAKMVDNTPRKVIQRRFDCLAALVMRLSFDANQIDLHNTVEVLVEGTSKRNDDILVGHSRKNQTVHFALPEGDSAQSYIGKLVDVRVDQARTWYLSGTPMGNPR